MLYKINSHYNKIQDFQTKIRIFLVCYILIKSLIQPEWAFLLTFMLTETLVMSLSKILSNVKQDKAWKDF